MAELVDALVSGASEVKLVEVQVLSWAPRPLPVERQRDYAAFLLLERWLAQKEVAVSPV